jgi:ABC-type transport system involved in cytochrome bd biosynthesis fused ATPase/permease subunit
LRQVVIMARVITVNDVLDGHMVLDIECLDRIYLNVYVPILQSSG